jgi:Aspartyl protease/PDZ domain
VSRARQILALSPVFLLLLHPSVCRSQSFTIPARIVNNLVLLDTRINDSPPVLFVLDTAASTTVIDQALSARLTWPTSKALDASTSGGTVEAVKVTKVTLHVGNLMIPTPDVVAIDLRGLSSGLGVPVGGILGHDVFQAFVVEIDYVSARVRFHRPNAYRPPAGAKPVPITLAERVPIVRGTVRNNGEAADAAFELDTGLTGAMTLLRPFFHNQRLRRLEQVEVPITSGALMPGKVPAAVTRVDGLKLGDFEMADVLTNVLPDATTAGLDANMVGQIGGDLLRRFDLTIDYPRQRILLASSDKRLREPMEFDMSGLSLASQGADYREHRIRVVIPGSPADAAGAQAGDMLVSVNKRAAKTYTLGELRQLLRKADQHYELVVTREGVSRTLTIRTRQLI